MSLSSSFTDFSLAELFQLIDQGQKSGCLTVCTLPDLHATGSKSQYFYIWFKGGRIVAAANRLNGHGLTDKIIQRGWVKQSAIDILTRISTSTPLGLHLKTQGILSAEQLNLLFASQLQQIRDLFEIQKGVFKLDSKATLPWQEMTGLSLKTTEVAMIALRALKNWKLLADLLPAPHFGIQSISGTKPQLKLNAFEWQVWEFANGSVDIQAIASQLNQPVHLVQQAAFRLMVIGLVQEVALVKSTIESLKDYTMDWTSVNSLSREAEKLRQPETLKVSTAFLQNLVGFLRSKA
ncbi:DUF4388 domain-containing protein [Iningainema tapete]|uniref:DUF4388 domain-containing protein n=1 Tax=Iningainema tapete BLCC-T55 TaxID=2748662 RepID=A0A8J6XLB5_9CYAN|nr:DUF4388 domain-containing protein [Iningainema tapete]MBD2774866.1 DUF4388 domain-containing protein [Iningainema tapete BLCC-T55]